MFLVLLSKEIRNHLQTFRFPAALLTTFLLVVVSVWVLGNDFIKQRDTHNQLSEQYAQQAKDVFIPSMISPTLLRAPTPLSIFAQGENKQLGNTVKISRWTVPAEAVDTLSNNWLLAAQPAFDLLAIFTMVTSIFGILLSYDGFCGERENGSLKLLCTFPPSRGTLFSAKFFASAIVLAIPFLLSFLSSLLILQFVHEISFTEDQWVAISMMFLAGLIFGTLFIGVGLLCSTLVSRSSTSLVLSLLIWSLGILLLPPMASSTSSVIHPVLPREEIDNFVQESKRHVSGVQQEYLKNKTPKAGWGWGARSLGAQSPSFFEGSSMEAWEDTLKYVRFYEPLWHQRADDIYSLEKKHLQQKKQQAGIANAFSSIAPAFQLREAFTALAGTNYNSYERFLETTRKYRNSMIKSFRNKGFFGENVIGFISRRKPSDIDSNDKISSRVASYKKSLEEGVSVWDVVSYKAHWDPLPSNLTPGFNYSGGKPDIQAALWPIGFLTLSIVIVFLIGFVAFTRYDVR